MGLRPRLPATQSRFCGGFRREPGFSEGTQQLISGGTPFACADLASPSLVIERISLSRLVRSLGGQLAGRVWRGLRELFAGIAGEAQRLGPLRVA